MDDSNLSKETRRYTAQEVRDKLKERFKYDSTKKVFYTIAVVSAMLSLPKIFLGTVKIIHGEPYEGWQDITQGTISLLPTLSSLSYGLGVGKGQDTATSAFPNEVVRSGTPDTTPPRGEGEEKPTEE